jgi:hypothetical protein
MNTGDDMRHVWASKMVVLVVLAVLGACGGQSNVNREDVDSVAAVSASLPPTLDWSLRDPSLPLWPKGLTKMTLVLDVGGPVWRAFGVDPATGTFVFAFSGKKGDFSQLADDALECPPPLSPSPNPGPAKADTPPPPGADAGMPGCDLSVENTGGVGGGPVPTGTDPWPFGTADARLELDRGGGLAWSATAFDGSTIVGQFQGQASKLPDAAAGWLSSMIALQRLIGSSLTATPVASIRN